MAKKANVAKYIDVIGNGQVLHTEYKQYESQFVHRAHDELYALLAKILQYVQSVLKRADCDAAISAVRKKLRDEHNINTTTKTGPIGVLLRLVLLDAHKKTLFTYKRTLQLAIDAGVEAADLADFIKRSNGIDQLSKSTEAKALANARAVVLNDQRILASYYLIACQEVQRLGSVKLSEKQYAQFCDSRNPDCVVYVACKYSNGHMNLLDFVPANDEIHNKALKVIFEKAFDKKSMMDEERKQLLKRTQLLEQAQVILPKQIPFETPAIDFPKAA